MSLFNHVMNLTGFGDNFAAPDKVARLLRPRTPITHVRWDGCMATHRHEVRVGELVWPEKLDGRYPGWRVAYPSGESWEPEQYMRIVNDKLEVWH